MALAPSMVSSEGWPTSMRVPCQALRFGGEGLCGAEEDGGVDVVAAGVHDADLGWPAGFLVRTCEA